MSAQNFEFQSSAKAPMAFTYKHSGDPKGEKFLIPGSIPARLMEVQTAGQRDRALKGQSKAEKEAAKQRIGTLMLDIFISDVLPPEMRAVLHLPDAGPIFEMWSEYVELGEDQSSAA